MKKVATIIYAVGWTQHTFGTQIIRTAAMLQLLLGNVGRAGGGVNALRGHSNIQGATDMAGVFDILPGYLKMPTPGRRRSRDVSEADDADAVEAVRVGLVQLLVEHAEVHGVVPEGDVRRRRDGRRTTGRSTTCPKIDRKYSWVEIWDDMYHGHMKGLFAFGMNGVAIGPNSHEEHRGAEEGGLAGRRRDLSRTRRASSGRRPGTTAEEMKKIKTTVYRLPCAGFAEKDGTFVNSARWLQWKNIALPPPGQAKLDQEILARIFLKVRDLYQQEGGKFPDPILNLRGRTSIRIIRSLAEVAREINGRALADVTDQATGQTIRAGQQVPGFAWLRDDGTTLCGNWLYSGSWTEAGNLTARRGTDDPSGLGIYPNWAWSWPANRRVMYNRASCDPSGKPWDPERRQVWWNERAAAMGRQRRARISRPTRRPTDHMGPFIMNPEGIGRIFAPLAAFADGPFPEHYEPIESPIANPLHPQQSTNPVVRKYDTPLDKYGTTDQGFNIVCTTYRLTEHYHYWTKNNPMNVQLVPEPFVEIPGRSSPMRWASRAANASRSRARAATTSPRRWSRGASSR